VDHHLGDLEGLGCNHDVAFHQNLGNIGNELWAGRCWLSRKRDVVLVLEVASFVRTQTCECFRVRRRLEAGCRNVDEIDGGSRVRRQDNNLTQG
ncbi:MAG: hypothetical protein RLZZ600_736, partial [Actinomycetota bacterium]